ncbi:ABC transporter substrate-binding protein [Clostridium sp. D2Q-11]|uniref:ABC transporter substrate-binding protein n=1 Tax=Anaeromonas frigoriresistens TaxID=2683708 RepID=A0A942UV34_9FIRM|nr:ABC transporter substrate-binding protein [Anaeromonas frigoriresistens]MBS4538045.1 ABC transporter substrate-binding protein [Anaeromonas frigoriresistens]
MRKVLSILIILTLAISLVACGGNGETNEEGNVLDKDWKEIVKEAKGTEVSFYGWGGSQQTNEWIDGFLADTMKEKYDIKVNRVPMNIEDILNKMLSEKQLDSEGSIDVVWINGENFSTAKKSDLLMGTFTDVLPNFEKNLDVDSEEVKKDFGHEVDGMEAPFGKAQFVMIYDEARVDKYPVNHKELMEFAKSNKGKFTYPAPPDFTGSAFVRNIIYDIVGYENVKDLEPNKEQVKEKIMPAIGYLQELKPYLWREGKTYPATIAQLDNMYADGEVVMDMTYNPNSAEAKVRTGEFPESTRTFLFENGTIGNTHFLSIPFNSPNNPGALVLINEILSIEAQASKYDPKNWGDLPVIDNSKLSEEEKALFEEIDLGEATLPQEELLTNRIPELPADLVPIIEEIWLENIPTEGE